MRLGTRGGSIWSSLTQTLGGVDAGEKDMILPGHPARTGVVAYVPLQPYRRNRGRGVIACARNHCVQDMFRNAPPARTHANDAPKIASFPKSAAYRDKSRKWGRLNAKVEPLLTNNG